MGSNNSLCRTHGRTALGSSRADGGGRRGHNSGGGSGGGRRTAVEARLGLDPPVGGGEERRTRGLKLCPPRVFTMAGLEKERRGWEEDSFRGDGEEMEWLGMKIRGGGGGGGGGLIRKVKG